MPFVEQLAQGFVDIFHLSNILAITIGILTGISVGALPGLTATMAVAIMTPITFSLSPDIGINLLLGVFGIHSCYTAKDTRYALCHRYPP